MVRQTTTTEGKRISFQIDKDYYIPGRSKSLVFNGGFKNTKYCVCYTCVYHDCGTRSGMLWGSPAEVPYDNGIIGGQNFNFFDNKNEAIEDYKARQKLTPKYGSHKFAYADVFFVDND